MEQKAPSKFIVVESLLRFIGCFHVVSFLLAIISLFIIDDVPDTTQPQHE